MRALPGLLIGSFVIVIAASAPGHGQVQETVPPSAKLSRGGQSLFIPSEPLTAEQLYLILNERDRQYAERFDAADKAMQAAVASIKEGTAMALTAADKATAAAFAAAKEAVLKAEAASEKRFESVNEFRAQSKDEQQRFSTKADVDVRFKAIADKLDDLTSRVTTISAHIEGAASLWNIIVVIVGLVFGMGGFVAVIVALARNGRRSDERATIVSPAVIPVGTTKRS